MPVDLTGPVANTFSGTWAAQPKERGNIARAPMRLH